MKTKTQSFKDGSKIVTCGHVAVKILPIKNGEYSTFRLTWKVGLRRMRRAISDEEKALEEAERIAKDLAMGEGQKTAVRGEEIIYLKECQKKLGSVPLHTAVDFYIKYHGIQVGKVKGFTEVAEEFLDHKKKMKKLAGKSETGDRYVQTLRTHLNSWETAFGDKDIRALTGPTIAKQLTEIWMDKYSLVTKQKLLGTLSSVMRFAQVKNYVSREHCPTAEVELPPAPLKTPEIYTPEELMKILICIDAKSIPYYAIMAFGGGRRSELEKSPVENINLEDGKMFIAPEIAKKNAGRALKIQKNLDLWLKEFAKYDGKLVESRKTSAPTTYKEKFEKVGIVWKRNGLRHSFCTYFTELTDNPVLASRVAGNSQKMLDKHYVSSNVKNADAQAWFDITPDAVRRYAEEKRLAGLLTW